MIEMKKLSSLLSFSEKKAVKGLSNVVGQSQETRYIASRMADALDVTRSVIVNAQTKLEIAGLIETASLGVSGTAVKVLDREHWEELLKEL